MSSQLIGVAIPTYNRSDLLDRMLLSIPKEISVFVSDNGGFTSDEVKSKHSNVVFSKTDSVVPVLENWNKATQLAHSCDYLIIPSDDDIFYETAFEQIRQEINENPSIDVFIFGNQYIDKDKKVFDTFQPQPGIFEAPIGFFQFQFGISARMPSIIFRKSFLDQIGYFSEEFKVTAGDSELIQRALLLGKSKCIKSIISGYTVWQGNSTSLSLATSDWMQEIELWTSKIATLVHDKYPNRFSGSYIRKYKDEIYAQNLLAGVAHCVKIKRGLEAIQHFKNSKFPKYAQIKTLVRLLKQLILAYIQQKSK